MRTITVALGEKTYNIEIAAGLLDQIGAKARVLSQAVKAAIISDSNVDLLYGERLERSLAASGFEVTRIVFAAGEQSKNLTVLGQIYDELARAGLTRSDLILTLGGGVPGDLGGFAVATFLRGIDFIQVPTSLLAQIDSSVGGKVAIDLPSGKNLAGSFYQPKAVFIDPDLLKTLPLRFCMMVWLKRSNTAVFEMPVCLLRSLLLKVIRSCWSRRTVLLRPAVISRRGSLKKTNLTQENVCC